MNRIDDIFAVYGDDRWGVKPSSDRLGGSDLEGDYRKATMMTHPPTHPSDSSSITDRIFSDYESPYSDSQTFLNIKDARVDPAAVARYGRQGLGEAEHEAMMYDITKRWPWTAPLSVPFLPIYEAGKMSGLLDFDRDETTIDPGWGSLSAGYRGMWRGLLGE